MEKNYGMSLSLQELNLSGNSIDKAGTLALESWFAGVKVHANLKRFLVARSGFILPLAPSMKHASKIEEIDLSGTCVL